MSFLGWTGFGRKIFDLNINFRVPFFELSFVVSTLSSMLRVIFAYFFHFCTRGPAQNTIAGGVIPIVARNSSICGEWTTSVSSATSVSSSVSRSTRGTRTSLGLLPRHNAKRWWKKSMSINGGWFVANAGCCVSSVLLSVLSPRDLTPLPGLPYDHLWKQDLLVAGCD